jgi:hypothetical protein
VSDFKKKYIKFYDAWDQVHDATLSEIDSLFVDCPDLSQCPHLFLFKGDILRDLGYSDLAVKYYLIGQKYIEAGHQNNKNYDHLPLIYYKLGKTYYELNQPKKMKEYLDKGKAYVTDNYSFRSTYYLNELEAMYFFVFGNEKEKALNLLEKIYDELLQHPEEPIYTIRNTTRLTTIEFALRIHDLERGKKMLIELKKDPWVKTIDGLYLQWFYRVNSDFYFLKKDYDNVKRYNDSIYHTKNLEFENREWLYEQYIKLYDTLQQVEKRDLYKDSLTNLLKLYRTKRQVANLKLTHENESFEKLVKQLERKNKKERYFWFLTFIVLLVLVFIAYKIFEKRRKVLKIEFEKESKRVELLNENYRKLLKNYQFSRQQMDRIKKTLLEESPDLYYLLIDNKLESHHSKKELFSFNQLRDDFILNIKRVLPTASTVESLICFYVKMGFTAKEISQITSLTLRSIQSHQYRLRKKVRHELKRNFDEFIRDLKLNTNY